MQSFAQLTTGEKYNLGPIGQPNQTLQIKGRAAYTVHPWYTSGDDGLLVDKHYTDSAIGSAVGTPSFSFVKGGNSFATSTQIGLGDNFSLTFITNNTEWAKLDSLGRFTIGPASGRMNAWPGLAGVLGNTGFGYQVMNATHTSAVNNSFFGSQAGLSDTSGSQNTGIGNGALKLCISCSDNTAIGYRSGGALTTGIQNTFGGSQSATAMTTASYNTALGYGTLASNTTANYNTAIGAFSNASGTGAGNTSVGAYGLQINGTGYSNVSMGNFNMNHNGTGFLNTALGSQALYLNTSGMQNTALGAYAGDSSATGYGGVFIGYMSGYHEQSNAKFHLADSLNAGRTLLYGDFLNRKLIVTPPGGNGTPSFLTGDNFQVNGSTYLTDTLSLVNTPAGISTDSVLVKHGNVVHAVAQSSIAGATNYQTVQSNTTSQTQRPKLNFSTDFTVTDNSGNGSTDIALSTSKLNSGTYTSTITGSSNISSVAQTHAYYTRNGNMIHANIAGNCTTTVVGTGIITVSLPLTGSTATSEYIGQAAQITVAGVQTNGFVQMASSTTATFTFPITGAGTISGSFIILLDYSL